jgi:murein DD-endopeptidase MepM/ murein hydrolase activator NlpD
VEVNFLFHGEMISSGSLAEINAFNPDRDGRCYALVEAIWESKSEWQKERSGLYCFAIDFDRPAIFSVNVEDIDPGELLVFYAEYLSPGDTVTVKSALPLNLRFAPYGRRQMIALAPVDYDIHPGSYPTILSVGNTSQSFDITVKDKEFAVQYVSIDPRVVAETRTEETNKEFKDRIYPILTEQLPELRWMGKAALSVPESKVLTLFGSRRYVNDDVNSYRHTGLDLEAPTGTKVKAANNGKVLFADYLAYTGNTILIEHGLGLKSWYYHLDELLVEPGDTVLRDDVIGLSGQTGFAAEPHLHLTMSVGDKYINPVTAINQPLFKEPLP